MSHRRLLIGVMAVLMCISLCSGCSDLKYHRVFMAGVTGAVVGGIVGHQSDEDKAGVAVGAALFATGDLLCQIDKLNEKKVKEAAEEVARGTNLLNSTYP